LVLSLTYNYIRKDISMTKLRIAILFAAILSITQSAKAGLNVLWYTGGMEANFAGEYKAEMGTNLPAQAAAGGNPVTVAPNSWSVTFWDTGAMPAGSFDVLVVASPQGGWSTFPNYTALNTAAPGITLGDRIMVTGQDADWHYINSPGPLPFNGAQGFLIDAINWAGNATGLGAVFLGATSTSGLTAFGLTPSLGSGLGSTNSVVIPAPVASFPINEGLTSAGLSNWSTSAHGIWSAYDPTVWTEINVSGGVAGRAVTLVSKATAGLETGTVPEPATLAVWVAFTGIGLAVIRRKKRIAA
jgi:hypothetical protein